MSQNKYHNRFKFISQAANEDDFLVVSFKGTEGISRLYNFEIIVISKAEIEAKDILNTKASLSLENDKGEVSKIYGYPTLFSEYGYHNGFTFYKVNLQPFFWKATQTTYNHIFLDKTVPEALKQILFSNKAFLRNYEFNLKNDYEKHEFSMIYNENIYEYMAYKLERDGIYYYFDQTRENEEQLIFVDDLTAHNYLNNNHEFIYLPDSGLQSENNTDTISRFSSNFSPLPKKVFTRDYNWLNPNVPVVGSAIVDEDSIGQQYFYGDGFTTNAQGDRLAKIRSEGLKADLCYFSGKSNIMSLSAGYIFTLTKHIKEKYNQDYLLTEIKHEGNQEAYLASFLGIKTDSSKYYYHNQFKCIPASQQFRVNRKRERKKIQGVITAFIDASSDMTKAEVDKYGRYKVLFPSDISGRKHGKSSCWVRRAKEFVGVKQGLSFPLTPGVEVIISFFDGNPDKPIISGAVNNAETSSLERGTGSSLNSINATGGSAMYFNSNSKDHTYMMNLGSGNTFKVSSASEGADSDISATQWAYDLTSASRSSFVNMSNEISAGIGNRISTEGEFAMIYEVQGMLGLVSNLLKSAADDSEDNQIVEKSLNGIAAAASLAKLITFAIGEYKRTNYNIHPYGTLFINTGYDNHFYLTSPLTAGKMAQIITYAVLSASSGITSDATDLVSDLDGIEQKEQDIEAGKIPDDGSIKNSKIKAGVEFGVKSVADILVALVPMILNLRQNKRYKSNTMGGILLYALERNIALTGGEQARLSSDNQVVLKSGKLSTLSTAYTNSKVLQDIYTPTVNSKKDYIISNGSQIRELAKEDIKSYSFNLAETHALNKVSITNNPANLVSALESEVKARAADSAAYKPIDKKIDAIKLVDLGADFATLATDTTELSTSHAARALQATYSSIDIEGDKFDILNEGNALNIKQNAKTANANLNVTRTNAAINNSLKFTNTANELKFENGQDNTLIKQTEKLISCTVNTTKKVEAKLTESSINLISSETSLKVTSQDINMNSAKNLIKASTSFIVKSDDIRLGSSKFQKANVNISSSGSVTVKGKQIKLG